MRYHKPATALLGEATLAIQGFNYKLLALLVDSANMPYFVTFAAYEADE